MNITHRLRKGRNSIAGSLKTIEGQIIEQLKTSPQSYFDDYAKLVAKTLNLNSFYLTQDGVVLYFQQYDIAPYAAGFPEFMIGVAAPFMI